MINSTPTPKRLTAAQINAMAEASPPLRKVSKGPGEGQIEGATVVRLNVNAVRPYDKNPRVVEDNPRFQEILDGIRTTGLQQKLYVTKRPGSSTYFLARGGKTRLRCLQALSKEDPAKWSLHDFEEVAYLGESDVMASHLSENLSRAGMCFWDTASGVAVLRQSWKRRRRRP